MPTLNLSPDLIADFKKILLDPKEYGFEFTPINEYYSVSKTIVTKHELAKAYIDHCKENKADLNKLVLYIIMDDIYGKVDGSDEVGNLGYFLKVNNN